MEKMIIIGDVHGKVDKFSELIQREKPNKLIQLGDFGFKKEHNWFLENMDTENFKIVFGNHDYIPYKNEVHSLGDFSFWNNIFTIRGAFSIDAYRRTEGLDWFRDEELEYSEFFPIFDAWEKHKPKIIVTHDCPQFVAHTKYGIYESSITRKAFDNLFEVHQPSMWLYGHHHKSDDFMLKGCNFICLDELEIYKF